MTPGTRLDRFRVPLTGQEIELQQLDYEGGGMSQLRVRIRERSRFTTVDVDPVTARYWAEAMGRWAVRHTPPASESGRGPEAREEQRDG
ncbi:MAG TPA: hypothetical protein VFR50_05570 [Casimicrobiaceae bacterium]|nr:hypothetical protein [Casimicrobiaceae bacterium]